MANVDDLLGVGESDEDDDLDLNEQDEDDELDADESHEDEPEDKKLGPAGEAALRKERKANRELTKRIRALEKAQQAPAKVADEDELRAKVRAELVQEYGIATAREAAVNVLTDLGYRGNAERGARSLDLSDVLDEDGKVDKSALREAVEDWREDEPALFRQVRRRPVEDDDDEEDEPPRRRTTNTDLGRKPRKKQASNPLEAALGGLVGSDRLHL